MPYIKKEKRPDMDKIVEAMIQTKVQANGDLNYILFKFAKENIKPSYSNYKNFLGELNETCEEIRRRILAPFEDDKILENGDIC